MNVKQETTELLDKQLKPDIQIQDLSILPEVLRSAMGNEYKEGICSDKEWVYTTL